MHSDHDKDPIYKGAIAWMARHPVASNLCMWLLLIGGIFMALQVKQEVFPEFDLDRIAISVPYPGASPTEVETGIIVAIEESVRGIDGVKEVTSIANEGSAATSVELMPGTNPYKANQDIKNAVDRITSFPQDAERPVVQLVSSRREVVSLILYGDIEETALADLADSVREDLLKLENITTVEISGLRPREIAIEIPQERLRALNLRLDQVAAIIRNSALELPGGSVKTDNGEILLRTDERRDFGLQYRDIPIVSRPDGTLIRLHEIAEIRDGFRDTDQTAYFEGKRAAQIRVFRVGKQKPLEMVDSIKQYVEELQARLPEGVGINLWGDTSKTYADRIDLLLRNAAMGLLLVLITLGLFLEIRVAFWVMMGIPTSILGSFFLIAITGSSINMVSLFAFLITLGIVVDDAIVVGENVYEYRLRGFSPIEAAVRGAREVAIPVIYSVLTNVVAFIPLFFVPGTRGKFFFVIPVVVVSVFLISLFESLFILPAHLAHLKPPKPGGYLDKLRRGQIIFSNAFETFADKRFRPVLRLVVTYRYVTLCFGVASLVVLFGIIAGGRLRFTFMPRVDSDQITVQVALPFGSPVSETHATVDRLMETGRAVLARYGGQKVSQGMFSLVGTSAGARGGGSNGGHLGTVYLSLIPSGERGFSANQFAAEWRKEFGDSSRLESLEFNASTGPSAGKDLKIELSHRDIAVLEEAASELGGQLESYSGVKDIDDGFSAGKPQLNLKATDVARALGLTASDIGNQVRNAFYGSRAFRQQRGRDEVWVMVRLPESERKRQSDIDELLIRTPQGNEIPLAEAALMDRGRSYTSINRRDGRRIVTVAAETTGGANANNITTDLLKDTLPKLTQKYPGLAFDLGYEQRDQKETTDYMKTGFLFALLGIFALLALPFRSYSQPAIIMLAIPFGVFGAILGHMALGYDLSLMSFMGMVALSGVVVNDSLVLIHAINNFREEGMPTFEAVVTASIRRLRPILLTSITTFCGLAPMIFETSVQARFLIPMAISLGFGVMGSTLLTLLIVPSLYLILEDSKNLLIRFWALFKSKEEAHPHEPATEA